MRPCRKGWVSTPAAPLAISAASKPRQALQSTPADDGAAANAGLLAVVAGVGTTTGVGVGRGRGSGAADALARDRFVCLGMALP